MHTDIYDNQNRKKEKKKQVYIYVYNFIQDYSEMSSYSVASGIKRTLLDTTLISDENPPDSYDVTIRFHSARV